MVIGLTGKLCAGKDLAVDVFTGKGWLVVDEDAIGHESLKAKSLDIARFFGEQVLDESGDISRRKLGTLVFSSAEHLKSLESIVHPWMIDTTRNVLDTRAAEHAVVNAAILFKMGLHNLCDSVLIVRAFALQRLFRCLSRDELPLKQVLQRMANQRSLNRAPKGVDTLTVWNTGSRDKFIRTIDRLFP